MEVKKKNNQYELASINICKNLENIDESNIDYPWLKISDEYSNVIYYNLCIAT